MELVYENKNVSVRVERQKDLLSKPHFHGEIEIVYVLQNTAEATVDQQSYILNPGDLFVVFPYQVHYYQTQPNAGDFLKLNLSPEILYGLHHDVVSGEPSQNVIHVELDSQIYDYIRKIRRAEGRYGAAEVCAFAILLMTKVLPMLELKPCVHATQDVVKTIFRYIRDHYTENLSLEIIAKELHLSRYYISHTLSKRTNIGFCELVNLFRVADACKQLKDTNQTVTEIGYNVGFSSLRSFNRVFMQIMKVTPQEYREGARQTIWDY